MSLVDGLRRDASQRRGDELKYVRRAPKFPIFRVNARANCKMVSVQFTGIKSDGKWSSLMLIVF